MPQYAATTQKPISPQDILTAKKHNLIAKGTTNKGALVGSLVQP
jgi:hypothetical protein